MSADAKPLSPGERTRLAELLAQRFTLVEAARALGVPLMRVFRERIDEQFLADFDAICQAQRVR